LKKLILYIALFLLLPTLALPTLALPTLALPTLALADGNPEGVRFGMVLQYAYNQHLAEFSKLPDTKNCCPDFREGSGTGLPFGLMIEVPIWDRLFINVKTTWGEFSGDLISSENETISVDGNPQPGTFEHRLITSMPALSLSPSLNYNFYDNFSFGTGFSFSFLDEAAYKQSEHITDPPDKGVFLDNQQRVRNQEKGVISDLVNTIIAFDLCLQYKLPLNKKNTLFLMPEFTYSMGLTDLIKDSTWKVDQYKFGVAIVFAPANVIKEKFARVEFIDTTYKTIPDMIVKSARGIPEIKHDSVLVNRTRTITEIYSRTDTIFNQKEFLLTADVHAFGLVGGKEKNISQIVTEEFQATKLKPLLNYIFFDENSAELADRYIKLDKSNIQKFNTDDFFDQGTLETYYDILNIIGYRLTQHPGAKIDLIGCGSVNTGESKDIANERAETIAEYLINTWSIAEYRINLIASRGLPKLPSNTSKVPGNEENRRVEIHSREWEIIKPIFSNDTLRVSDPPYLRFYPAAEADAGVKSWKLIAKNYKNNSELPIIINQQLIPEQFDWRVDTEFTKNADTLYYFMEVEDQRGKKAYSEIKPIPLESITIEYKLENKTEDFRFDDFSLILFDFDSDVISSNNKKITDFIKEYVKENSTVEITGYTDSMGEELHNKKLSQSRAGSVERLVGNKQTEADGVGEEIELYPNSTPEGRFYSRTVEIKIVTPLR
jgi:outer membrane protein OmpA-like peptidoglycan-associated protein